ncbi:hypothetical protein MHBO_001413 [Bonamia ostreae]|uniref:Uncharacterized protein n=1 Tax=Bonamia ostreae TaxID=126728 RepID=A0ABV2AJR3_9EUKA
MLYNNYKNLRKSFFKKLKKQSFLKEKRFISFNKKEIIEYVENSEKVSAIEALKRVDKLILNVVDANQKPIIRHKKIVAKRTKDEQFDDFHRHSNNIPKHKKLTLFFLHYYRHSLYRCPIFASRKMAYRKNSTKNQSGRYLRRRSNDRFF